MTISIPDFSTTRVVVATATRGQPSAALHAGHVACPEEAKSLGDRIVAVNDDDSVRRLKGEARPVNALEDRMLVLAFRDSHSSSRIIDRLRDE